MPRVLITGFCAVPGPRRAGVQLRHVIRALTPLHNVDLLVQREGEQAYVERQGSVRVLRVPMNEADPRSQVQSFQRALKRQLEGADYDVVHCRDPWSCLPVLEARSRHNFAVIYDLARSPLGETSFDVELDSQYARDEDICLTEADLVLAPTQAAVNALKKLGDRVMLSPPGVDVDRFDWEEHTKSGAPRIVYAGSIDPGRGVRVLVRAMAAIAKESDARLVMAGTMAPKFEDTLREGIRELGLNSRVDILAPVDHDQLPALLATAAVCVVPAAADLTPNPMAIFPTKVLEYMACRRAIVAPKRETIAQVVSDGREALLFEPGDPIDLARKVLRLLGEPTLRDRVALSAYERVRRDFTASAARRALRKAYDFLAARFELDAASSDDESPKVEMLSDDDFEATVFEEQPAPAAPVDTNVSRLHGVDDDGEDGTGSGEGLAAPPGPARDDTAERPMPLPPAADDWVVTNVAAAVGKLREVSAPAGLRARAHTEDDDEDEAVSHPSVSDGVPRGRPGADDDDDDELDDDDLSQELSVPDDGTPIEGVVAAAPALLGSSFVAGEIEVPTATPPPGPRPSRNDSPSIELTSASAIIAGTITTDVDADTGSHRR